MSKFQPPSDLMHEARAYYRPDQHHPPGERVAETPRDPAGAATLHRLATAAFQAGRLDTAISYARQAIEADPGNADGHNILAVFYTTAAPTPRP